MKKFFQEFKKFISRGNVIDLAVGVIVGGAFTAIVTALTGNIFMPIINYILLLITGGKGLEGVYTFLGDPVIEEGVIVLEKSIYINWGAFITAIINFILIAFVVFVIVKLINKAKEAADIDGKLISVVQKKLNDGEDLTLIESKWLALYNKKHADAPLKKEEPVEIKAEEPKKEEPTATEKLLAEFLSELKNKK